MYTIKRAILFTYIVRQSTKIGTFYTQVQKLSIEQTMEALIKTSFF